MVEEEWRKGSDGLRRCMAREAAARYESSLRATQWQYNAGTHATRRDIAVAISLAFNKGLQQHMLSTTLVREQEVRKGDRGS